MATVDIANLPKPIAVGLDWRALKGATSERKEIDSLTNSEGSKFGCVISDDEAGVTIVGLSHDKAQGVNCGAAWLAAACGRNPVILVEPLEDDRLWMCAVRAGLPVQDMDIVIDAQQLHAKLQDFQLQSPDAKICSTLDNLDKVYDRVSPQSFAELVANTPAPKIVRISGVSPLLIGVILLFLAAAAGWYGFDVYMTNVGRQEARAKLARINSDQQRRDAESEAKAKQDYINSGEAMLRTVILDQPAVDTVIGAIFKVVESKPLNMVGWAMTGFDCDPRECRLRWKRGQGSTMFDFLKAAEAKGWPTEELAGNDAVTTHPLTVASRGMGVDSLDKAAPFIVALESKLQEASAAGLRYEVSKPAPLEKMMAVAPSKKGKGQPVAVFAPLPWKIGTLIARGSNLFELRELPGYVTHPGLSIKRVSVDIKTKEWTLEMNYATR